MSASNQDQGHASIMLGFLDVISCGFAAVLVLAVILSIIRTSAAKTPPQGVRYMMFEFSVELPPSDGEPITYLLLPEISYTDAKKVAHRFYFNAHDSTLVDQDRPDGNLPFAVELAGFNDDPPAMEAADGSGHGPRQVWLAIFSNLPEGVVPNVEVRYSGEREQFRPVEMRRSVWPPPPNQQDPLKPASTPLPFANQTRFGPPRSP